MTINLGWKILQKKNFKNSGLQHMHLADLIVKWLFDALQKTPKFIGQWQILFLTEFPQVFDLGADGKGMSYVASLTQYRITQRAASTARYEYFILLSHFALWWPPILFHDLFFSSAFLFFISSFCFPYYCLSFPWNYCWLTFQEIGKFTAERTGNGFFLRMLVSFL